MNKSKKLTLKNLKVTSFLPSEKAVVGGYDSIETIVTTDTIQTDTFWNQNCWSVEINIINKK